ncbi:MAG: NAD(P)/FAD-dependent oxidoreductase [Candidatus Sungbacteria bacterium]|nr:NAD(P)/FAD-dependent oxidoreductase [Candidatus Sungbacteria bacterium]
MSNSKKNIVISGAGFGGITAALTLAKRIGPHRDTHEIILIDRHHHQLYTPSLYQIAAIALEDATTSSLKSSILIPLADIFKNKPVLLITDEIIGFEFHNKKLALRSFGQLPYEFLVLALGAETAYYDIPGLKEYSFPLKTFDDALRLRNVIEENFKTKSSIKITIGGGGASGVELAAEFVGFICHIAEKFTKKRVCEMELVLIEASPQILPGFSASIIKKSGIRLRALGVQILTGSPIIGVQKNEATLQNGHKEKFDVLIWTGGVVGPTILKKSGLTLSEKNSAEVNQCLQTIDFENIFAVGDNAMFINPKTGKALPGSVPIAKTEGRLAARNIIRAIEGKPPKKFTPLAHYPFILAVGKKYAIADLIIIHFSGIFGWIAKELIELRYFLFILPIHKALRTWYNSIKIIQMHKMR